MTTLLEQALAALEKLPADAQDAIATRLFAEVADEHAWAERFEATTDARVGPHCRVCTPGDCDGGSGPLDDVLPPRIRP